MALSNFIPDSSGGYPDELTASTGNQDVLIQNTAYIVWVPICGWISICVDEGKKIIYMYDKC